jgi:hypothetical protein
MIVPVRERSPMGSDAVARLVQQRHEAVGQGRDAESGRGGGALVRTARAAAGGAERVDVPADNGCGGRAILCTHGQGLNP